MRATAARMMASSSFLPALPIEQPKGKQGMILIDSGTGETKLYLVHVANLDDHGRPVVAAEQIGETMPAAKDCYEQARATAEIGCQAFSGPYAENLKAALQKAMLEDINIMRIVLGLTAWFRGEDGKKRVEIYRILIQPLLSLTQALFLEIAGRGMRLEVETLGGLYEAECEKKAIEYACSRTLGIKDLDMVVSGGKGSIQFTPAKQLGKSASAALAMKRGEEILKDDNKGIHWWASQCDVALSSVVGGYREEIEKQPANRRYNTICISAFFYGAKAAGLVNKEPQSWTMKEAMAKIKEFLDKDDNKPVDKANLVRIQRCFELMFPEETWEHVNILFARDWTVEGKPFRTTWSSGYFLIALEDMATTAPADASPTRIRSSMASLRDVAIADRRCCVSPVSAMSWIRNGFSSEDSRGRSDVSIFDNVADTGLSIVPYSDRVRFQNAVDCVVDRDVKHWMQWLQIGVGKEILGGKRHEVVGLGLEVRNGQDFADDLIIVVGFIQLEDERDFPGPKPALGYSRRTKQLCPVVDIGLTFDAKDNGGCIRFQVGSETESDRYHAWDPCQDGLYEVWIAPDENGISHKLSVAQGKVIIFEHEIDKNIFDFSRPCVAHVWTASASAAAEGPELDTSGFLASCSGKTKNPPVTAVTMVLQNPTVCQACGWFCGSLQRYFRNGKSRVMRCWDRALPDSFIRSFNRYHENAEGACTICTWPIAPALDGASSVDHEQWTASRSRQRDKSGSEPPPVIATAGGGKVVLWDKFGDVLVELASGADGAPFPNTAWSVAILSCDQGKDKGRDGWFFRLLVGSTADDETRTQGTNLLSEIRVFVPDSFWVGGPFCSTGNCDLEWDSIPGTWDSNGKPVHKETVSGIAVDVKNARVYTVSHDATVAMWSIFGKLIHQEDSWHNERLHCVALSGCRNFLATCGHDARACIWDVRSRELNCVARVEFGHDDLTSARAFFSVQFLPNHLWKDPSNPDKILLGDRDGCIRLVPLHWKTARQSLPQNSGNVPQMMTIPTFLGRLHPPHTAHVFSLSWVRKEKGLGNEPEWFLCSSSADKTIHVYPFACVERVMLDLREDENRKCNDKLDSGVDWGSEALHAPEEGFMRLKYHEGPIRAVVSSSGVVLTADSGSLARWDDIGENVFPDLIVSNAKGEHVSIILLNNLVTMVQSLRYTVGSEAFSKVENLKAVRVTTHIATLDLWSVEQMVRHWSDWIRYMFLWVACIPWWWNLLFFFSLSTLSVMFIGQLATRAHDIFSALQRNESRQVIRRSSSLGDLDMRRVERESMRSRGMRYQLVFNTLFNVLAVPILQAFTHLIDCTVGEDGVRHMDIDRRILCFQNNPRHMAAVLFWGTIIVCYVLIAFLFEVINGKLANLFMVKIEGKTLVSSKVPGQQKDKSGLRSALMKEKLHSANHWEALEEDADHEQGRQVAAGGGKTPVASISTLQVLSMAGRSLVRAGRVQMPKENVGSFTSTENTLPRFVRLALKISFPAMQVFQTTHVRRRMAFFFVFSLLNVAVNVVFPPVQDRDLMAIVMLAQVIMSLGAFCGMFEVWSVHTDQLTDAVGDTIGMFFNCAFLALFVFVVVILCMRRGKASNRKVNDGYAELATVMSDSVASTADVFSSPRSPGTLRREPGTT